MILIPPRSTLFPYTTLFRSIRVVPGQRLHPVGRRLRARAQDHRARRVALDRPQHLVGEPEQRVEDRKSTRLNSSHQIISYAVFCLKKKIISIYLSSLNEYEC